MLEPPCLILSCPLNNQEADLDGNFGIFKGGEMSEEIWKIWTETYV